MAQLHTSLAVSKRAHCNPYPWQDEKDQMGKGTLRRATERQPTDSTKPNPTSIQRRNGREERAPVPHRRVFCGRHAVLQCSTIPGNPPGACAEPFIHTGMSFPPFAHPFTVQGARLRRSRRARATTCTNWTLRTCTGPKWSLHRGFHPSDGTIRRRLGAATWSFSAASARTKTRGTSMTSGSSMRKRRSGHA